MKLGGSKQYHRKFIVGRLKKESSKNKKPQIVELSSVEKTINKKIRKQQKAERKKRNKEKFEKVKTAVKVKTKKAVKQSWTKIHNAGAGFWFLILFVALLILAFFFNMEELVLNTILNYGYVGIFIITFFSELFIQPVGPDIPLIMAIVFTAMNPFWVLFSVLIGSWTSLIVAYYVGRKLGAPGIQRIIGRKKWDKIEKNENYGKWALFLGAISPVPYIPYLAGLFELSFKDTLKYVIIPRSGRFLVETIASVFFGDLMEKLFL